MSYNALLTLDEKPNQVDKTSTAIAKFFALMIAFFSYGIGFSEHVHHTGRSFYMFPAILLIGMGLFVLSGVLNPLIHIGCGLLFLLALYYLDPSDSVNSFNDGTTASWILLILGLVLTVLIGYSLWKTYKTSNWLAGSLVASLVGCLLLVYHAGSIVFA